MGGRAKGRTVVRLAGGRAGDRADGRMNAFKLCTHFSLQGACYVNSLNILWTTLLGLSEILLARNEHLQFYVCRAGEWAGERTGGRAGGRAGGRSGDRASG